MYILRILKQAANVLRIFCVFSYYTSNYIFVAYVMVSLRPPALLNSRHLGFRCCQSLSRSLCIIFLLVSAVTTCTPGPSSHGRRFHLLGFQGTLVASEGAEDEEGSKVVTHADLFHRQRDLLSNVVSGQTIAAVLSAVAGDIHCSQLDSFLVLRSCYT